MVVFSLESETGDMLSQKRYKGLPGLDRATSGLQPPKLYRRNSEDAIDILIV